ncbi:MAG: PAS domain S-box protein [bacterium]|nr:PAS domain S-box protein [bacterium]
MSKPELLDELAGLRKSLTKLENLARIANLNKSLEFLNKGGDLRRLATVVCDSNDAITIQDSAGKILAWNHGAEQMFGYSEQEALQMKIWQLASPLKVAEQEEFTRRIFAGEKVSSFETQRLTKDGRLLDVWLTVTKLVDDEGKVIAIASTERDITEIKKHGEELLDSEQKYREIVTRMDEAYYRCTMEGVLLEHNKAFNRILGFDIEKNLKGEKLPDFWQNPDDRKQYLEEFKAKGLIKNYLINAKKITNEKFVALANAHLVKDVPERSGGIEGTFIDITDHRRMEKELLKTSKLESLSLLAGGIAHDFNNILTGIMANISIARNMIKPGEEALEPIMDAEQASLRARDLIRQLLLFARGGNQAREFTSLAGLLREVTGFILSGSSVAPRFVISDNLWPIEANAGQIYQVFENLVINAKQAMNKGGILEIRGENIVAGEESAPNLKPGRYVRVSVKDEGEGIPEQNLARIFDPYFTTKKEGSGLGLAVTFSIIKNHGGHIDVGSRVGEGTIFEVYLPALASDEEARVEMISPGDGQTENGKGKVLVMDDEESIRKTLGRLLGFMNYRVDFAVCGEEAIEMYRKAKESGKNYAAAIMDLTVPGKMGGKEAAGIINEIDPKARLIVSSGYSDEDLMSNYKNYGFIGVMVKPYTVKELQETLERVIQN